MNEQTTRDFVALMSVNQMQIYAYVMSIVGNSNDADDIMQNTSAFMWEKFCEFQKGTDFVSWGIAIAYFKIKEFRKQKSRCQFSDELLDELHRKSQEKTANIGIFIEKLQECLNKLPPSDLNIIKLRYEAGNSIKRISQRINVTVQAVYRKLSVLHGILSRCIRHSIIQESIR